MKIINKIKILLSICFLTTNLYAIPVVIDLGLTTGVPSDLTSEYNRLLTQINTYNLTHDDLIIPAFNNGIKTEIINGGTSIEIDFNTDFTGYLMFKWGNMDQFYYVKDLDEYTFNSTVQNIKSTYETRSYLGLSHWDNWEITPPRVPDAGSSLAMLGLSSVGLLIFRRKIV